MERETLLDCVYIRSSGEFQFGATLALTTQWERIYIRFARTV
jgi:hypothetical protein